MVTLRNSQECPHCSDFFVPGGAYASHVNACADGGKTRRKRTRYRELFFAHNGAGPYECYFQCGSLVTFDEVIVHHKDDDFTNDAVANLAPAHRVCHNGHHFKELWAERRPELLASQTRGHRTPHSEETRRKISETKKSRGQAPTQDARDKALLARRARVTAQGGDVL